MNINRKLVPPLTREMITKLAELYVHDVARPVGVDVFEFSIGQLYKRGILQIKKRVEKGVFIFFISISESAKELLKTMESSLEPEYNTAAEMTL
jgi:hypothetical protein